MTDDGKLNALHVDNPGLDGSFSFSFARFVLSLYRKTALYCTTDISGNSGTQSLQTYGLI
jgi:hypothetical protein